MLKMIGPAPLARVRIAGLCLAVVATVQFGMPDDRREVVAVRRTDVDLRLGPVARRDRDVDDDATGAVGVAVGRGDASGRGRVAERSRRN